MNSSLTAVLLCICVQAAAAQCVAPVPVAQDLRASAIVVKTTAQPEPVRAGGELIKAAAASTHDERPSTARTAPAARPAGDDQQRRGGPAMLWAALALMSGIALRRYSANK